MTTPAQSPYGNYAYSVLTAQARRNPDDVALRVSGNIEFTYAALDRHVNQRANALLAHEIQSGTRVGCLLHDPGAITSVYLALAKIGAVAAALNPFWTEEVLIAVVQRSGSDVFVYDRAAAEVVARIRAQLPQVRAWLATGGAETDVVDLDAATDAAPDTAPALAGYHDDPLALYFTSGSTGLPKAVVHTHDSAISNAQLWLDVPRSADSVFGSGPIIWGVGFMVIAGPALYAGMPLVLESDFGPKGFLAAVPRERISHISVIPSFFTELLRTDGQESADLSSLRVILLGGEPVLPSLLRRIQQRLPQVQVLSYYGQTEAPYTCFQRQDAEAGASRAVGRPRLACAVKVVDAAGRRVVGDVGEVWLSGPHVMAGYDGQLEETAAAMRDGWYTGGDLGVLDTGGMLTVLGRRQDAINRNGTFVIPTEVEEAALDIPGVAEAGVVGVPDCGDQQRILLAVLPAPDAELTAASLRAELGSRLAVTKRPDAVVIVDEMPHANDSSGGQGKLLRREILTRWGHLAGPDSS